VDRPIATGDGSADDWIGHRLCVTFHEAMSWIAFRNFNGKQDACARPFLALLHEAEEYAEKYAGDLGRLELAGQFLTDRAAKGKIRLYAWEGWKEDEGKEVLLSFPLQLPTAFLARATFTFDQDYGNTFFVPEEERYNRLGVDRADLVQEFWGDTEVNPNPIAVTERPSSVARQPSALFGRRGRPPQYRWQEFAAEMVRRSLAGPIPNQAALEQHMAQWCVDNWGGQPASSVIREWVQPTFKMMRRSAAEGQPANGADDSSRDFSASPK
jgi:hypothetical protein